jgi:predicted short-subunit dehydrogenase-like oxidoreductase (DUF2520 family)
MDKLTLNIIGCGNLGKSLAQLWADNQCFKIGQILNRSLESSTSATDFIGAGAPIGKISDMHAADVYLIATPDNEIINACKSLLSADLLKAGDVVFHCSGALGSGVLDEARHSGVHICSAHPVKSFANPVLAVESFEGTYCGVEGDDEALAIIEEAMQKIGGIVFQVQAESKIHYHAASVMVCNYLTALIEVGIQTYQRAGIDRETAMQVMQPMVRGTLNNVFTQGTVDALSGPVARGDDVVLQNQLAALTEWKPEYAEIYTRLGAVALELSREQGNASEEALERMSQCLSIKKT